MEKEYLEKWLKSAREPISKMKLKRPASFVIWVTVSMKIAADTESANRKQLTGVKLQQF
jgi:hypothetical protein